MLNYVCYFCCRGVGARAEYSHFMLKLWVCMCSIRKWLNKLRIQSGTQFHITIQVIWTEWIFLILVGFSCSHTRWGRINTSIHLKMKKMRISFADHLNNKMKYETAATPTKQHRRCRHHQHGAIAHSTNQPHIQTYTRFNWWHELNQLQFFLVFCFLLLTLSLILPLTR